MKLKTNITGGYCYYVYYALRQHKPQNTLENSINSQHLHLTTTPTVTLNPNPITLTLSLVTQPLKLKPKHYL